MQVIGIDIGFGFTKIISGSNYLMFKSVIGDALEVQFKDQFVAAQDQESFFQVDLNGRSYFVGSIAEQQSSTRHYTMDQERFVAKFAQPLALAALARMANGADPIKIVTGLPIRYLQKQKKIMRKLLSGRHTLLCTDQNESEREVILDIDDVRVIPQPFGSVFGLLLNDHGGGADTRLLKQKVGVIDIGFCTTDYTISDRTRYIERGSATSEMGIAKAFRRIADELNDKCRVDIELFRLYEAVHHGSIRIFGKSIDITELTNNAFQSLAADIANEIQELWADEWDLDSVLITGGGGAVLAPYLESLLAGEINAIGGNDDARLNNVLGYWRYGKNQWDRTSANSSDS
ncbi:MAG: ParM/StbA family protein [Gammaproteobacteria bacterium]|nr:ParM/StbA family protein [Gammaproteobacteria bacterium]